MNVWQSARFVLASGVLIAGSLAGAQGPGAGPGFGQNRPPMERALGAAGMGGQWWNRPNLAKQLNLTDGQRTAMDGILQDHKMKLIDLQANLQKAEITLEPMMKADAPDRKAIEAQIDKVVAARAELEKANARFLLDIRMQLKPEQWKQLQTLRANRMQHEPMGGMGAGGWGPNDRAPGMGGPPSPPPQGDQPPGNGPQTAPAPGSGVM